MKPFTLIKQLIADKKQLAQVAVSEPHDYASVREKVLQLELIQELEQLDELLTDPSTFASHFIRRCHQRNSGEFNAIGFDQLPMSETNQLYWQIASLLFEPKTIADMITILMPTVQQHLQITLPTEVDGSLTKAAKEGFEPECHLHDSLSGLTDEPSLTNLSNYVIKDGIILNVVDIQYFPLRVHAKLKSQLDATFPALSKQLYEHNQVLSTLKSDIAQFTTQAISPYQAIEWLIKGLTMGGARMTGGAFAGAAATTAISEFITYFDKLPASLQNHLKQLSGDNISIESVIENELKKGTCVETASLHLQVILEANQSDSLIRQPSQMTAEG